MKRPQLAEFVEKMQEDSLAIIPSANEVTRSADTHFRFRQNSDFYYLTGFDEPESIAAVVKKSGEQKYILFVRPRDPEREVWDGTRAGVEGAKEKHGADEAFEIKELDEKLQELLDGARTLYYRLGDSNPALDEMIIAQLAKMRTLGRKGITPPDSIIDPGSIIHEMRLVKTPDEIEAMQQAADIAADAHREAMKAAKPGMKEYEIEALIEYIFRKNGASGPAYTSIVGTGANATVLHYVRNEDTLKDGDLLLIDAGAEFKGYASDITRTFPVNGRFTDPQRAIYDLVLRTQTACIDRVRPGVTVEELQDHAVRLLTEGMVELRLLKGDVDELIKEENYKKFYMHRLGHFLGMDVHDVGRYYEDDRSRKLQAGMVKTIEPGIYIAVDAEDVPDEYRGIGVRIEDDVLVTASGHKVLSSKAPKQIEEIEELMRH